MDNVLCTGLKKSYQRDGYIVVNEVLSKSEIEALKLVLDSDEIKTALNAIGIANIYAKTHISDISLIHPALKHLARHKSIVKIIQYLIGENIQLHHSAFGNKPPLEKGGGVNWHKDYPYFPHTNTDFLGVMIPLDDMTTDNGCLQVKPGSHKEKISCNKYIMDMKTFYSDPQINNKEQNDNKKIVDVKVSAGGISVHNCLTTHASRPNTSDGPRRTIIFQYRADDNYQIAGRLFNDTGTLIAGKRQSIVRCDVGIIDIAKILHAPEYDTDHPEISWHQEGKNCS